MGRATRRIKAAPLKRAEPTRAHVVSHTHWDRAWYWTVEETRVRLVDLIDRLLEIFASDRRYRRFTLDGQVAVVLDYLAVHPERRTVIARHVREGRLLVGPLLVLPDLFIPRAESLVRNLRIGLREARALGRAPDVAHIPDPFGYPAQLPQLLAGFGLRGVVFARGMGDQGARLGSDFWWEAPDGSQVLATHLVGGGYANLAHLGEGEASPPGSPRPRPRPGSPERLARACRQIAKLVDAMADDAPPGLRLLSNGSDHLPPDPAVPALLVAAEHRLPRLRLIHSDYPAYQRAVRRAIEDGSFQPAIHRGELRGARYAPLLPGVLSARTDLKLQHDRCERLLLRWVEPLAALARALGLPAGGPRDDRALIDRAWRLLLLCQPHDDICGCSVDAVHDDDHSRMARSSQLARALAHRSLADLASGVAGDGHGEPLWLNPHPWPLQAVVELPGETRRLGLARLPALGFGRSPRADALPDGVAPVRASTRSGRIVIDNGLLALEVERDNGRITLTDLRPGGLRFARLAELLDEGDAGDTYDFCSPAVQRTYGGVRPKLRLLSRGPLRAEIELGHVLSLPAGLTADRRRRQAPSHELAMSITLGIDASSPLVRLRVAVSNTVDEHRLRLAFPAPFACSSSWAGAPFELARRPLAPPAGRGWVQPPAPTLPFQTLVALERPDRQAGVAVIANGLREYEARRRGARSTELLLTLLRSVRRLSRDDLTSRAGHAGPDLAVEGARQLGDHRFDCAILPLIGPLERSDALAHARLFADPPCPVAARPADSGAAPGGGRIHVGDALLEVRPRQVVLSALEPAASGQPTELDLRLLNPTRCHLRARVLGQWTAPRPLSLDGTPLSGQPTLDLDAIELPPGRALSLRVAARRGEGARE